MGNLNHISESAFLGGIRMDVEIKRDGIILRGKIEKPYNTNNKKISDKYPALIIFHGFAGDLGYDESL